MLGGCSCGCCCALLIPAQGQEGFFGVVICTGAARSHPSSPAATLHHLSVPARTAIKAEVMRTAGHERALQELIKEAEHGVFTARILRQTGLGRWSGKEENSRGCLKINLRLSLLF